MRFDAKKFLSKAVGEDFLETLAKTELYKPNANVAIDLDDIRIGLKVVPRVIMSLLIRELAPMQMGQAKSIPLMLGNNAILNANKHDTDTYSGSITDNGKILVSFKFRPLPGVGLVIMSAFELYEVEEPKNCAPGPDPFFPSAADHVQKLIDERLAMHHMVSMCVEKKMMEREAIQQLFMAKIKEAMEAKPAPMPIPAPIPHAIHSIINEPLKEALSASEEPVKKSAKKESPLKGFLDKRAKKNEFQFKVIKSDISCPDCKQEIFKSGLYLGCICLGNDWNNKVFIKKNEDGIKIRFPKSWDSDNISTLLEIIKSKNLK